MRREPLKYLFLAMAVTLLSIEIWLLLSGNRILLDEKYYPAQEETFGISFYIPAEAAKFECTYFTGRKRVFETLPSYEYDECPFIWTES